MYSIIIIISIIFVILFFFIFQIQWIWYVQPMAPNVTHSVSVWHFLSRWTR